MHRTTIGLVLIQSISCGESILMYAFYVIQKRLVLLNNFVGPHPIMSIWFDTPKYTWCATVFGGKYLRCANAVRRSLGYVVLLVADCLILVKLINKYIAGIWKMLFVYTTRTSTFINNLHKSQINTQNTPKIAGSKFSCRPRAVQNKSRFLGLPVLEWLRLHTTIAQSSAVTSIK